MIYVTREKENMKRRNAEILKMVFNVGHCKKDVVKYGAVYDRVEVGG